MVVVLLFVMSLIVLFIGALLIIHIGGAIASAVPLIVLLPVLDPIVLIVGTLWDGLSSLRFFVDDNIMALWRR